MSSDWEVLTLSELTINYDTKRKPVKGPDRKPGPYPYYGASGIVDYVEGYIFDGDYLLIAEDGENLRTRQTPIAFMATGKFWVNNHAHIVTGNERANTRYLQYALSGTEISGYLTGAVMPKLTQGNMNKIELRCPPRKIQDQIVFCLGALDDRITLLRETNATLEAIAQALFKSWFVDFDPVRAKAAGLEPQAMDATTAALFPDSLEESELGLVPKGWRMSTLGAICDSNGGAIQTGPFGSQLHAADYVVDGVPVVMPKDISNRRVDASTAARVRLEDVQRLARHQLRDGDIVFSRRGDVEKHALIGETERGWLCGTGCLLVRPGTRRNVAGYLSRSLDLPQIKQWLTQHAVGATMPNLNTGILSAVPVVLPADEILAAFEQATNALDKRISAGNAAAQTLTQLRDTLLPRLISGQLRLPEAEALLEEAV